MSSILRQSFNLVFKRQMTKCKKEFASRVLICLTFFKQPTRLLVVFVPGKLYVASLPPTKAVFEAKMEKLPEVIQRSV